MTVTFHSLAHVSYAIFASYFDQIDQIYKKMNRMFGKIRKNTFKYVCR